MLTCSWTINLGSFCISICRRYSPSTYPRQAVCSATRQNTEKRARLGEQIEAAQTTHRQFSNVVVRSKPEWMQWVDTSLGLARGATGATQAQPRRYSAFCLQMPCPAVNLNGWASGCACRAPERLQPRLHGQHLLCSTGPERGRIGGGGRAAESQDILPSRRVSGTDLGFVFSTATSIDGPFCFIEFAKERKKKNRFHQWDSRVKQETTATISPLRASNLHIILPNNRSGRAPPGIATDHRATLARE